ncbi:MAG: radical SAM protein [Kiritimatiellaeota bacterium]|nr:radical SAM protein [Kiritimatiellota bacterium]
MNAMASGMLNMAGMGLRMVAHGYVSPRKVLNFIRCLAHPYMGNVISTGYPPALAIDPSATCNLGCFACPAGNAAPTPLKNMNFADYTKLIDEVGAYALITFLYVTGEPFMNKDLARYIEYAHRKRIYTVVSTNGHFINTPEQAEKIVNSGLDDLIITISGLSQEVYEKYHRHGHIATVLKGLDNLVAARIRLGKKSPKLTIRYVEFAYNLEERDKARAHFMKSGADAFTARAARGNIAPGMVPQELKGVMAEYKQQFIAPGNVAAKQPQYRRCLWPWLIAVVNWDGVLTPCTQYPWVKEENTQNYLGNVFKEGSFQKAWQGRRLMDYRTHLLDKNLIPDSCKNCIRSVGFGDDT